MEESCGGTACTGDDIEFQSCSTDTCPLGKILYVNRLYSSIKLYPVYIVNCAWSEWSMWGTCDATCGGGTQVKRRTINTLAANGGADCPGYEEEIQDCGTVCCPGEFNFG